MRSVTIALSMNRAEPSGDRPISPGILSVYKQEAGKGGIPVVDAPAAKRVSNEAVSPALWKHTVSLRGACPCTPAATSTLVQRASQNPAS